VAPRFRVPDGVAGRIRSRMALGTMDVDEASFPRDPSVATSPSMSRLSSAIEWRTHSRLIRLSSVVSKGRASRARMVAIPAS